MSRDIKLAKQIIAIVKESDGIAPKEVHKIFIEKGFSSETIRDNLSILWDEGEIILGADRKLRTIKEIK